MSTTKIDGGPGAGKTTTLVNIILDSGLPANKIAYCTFGKKALNEMKERMISRGEPEDNLRYFRTLHSMNFHLLGLKMENVANKKLADFCTEKGFRLSDKVIRGEKKLTSTEDILGIDYMIERLDDQFYIQMNRDRIEVRPFEFVHPRLRGYTTQYLKFKYAYFDWLREHEYVDFIGMIERGIEKGVLPPVDLLCIDEWQDLNPLQIKQVLKWAENIPMSYHAADPNQCIHEWCGANPSAFLDLPCNDEIILEQSFRLPSDVLALSQEVITKNKVRKEKTFYTKKPEGGIHIKRMTGLCEMLKGLPKGDTCFVLVRNNCVIKYVMRDLILGGVPVGGFVNERAGIQLMQTAYEKGNLMRRDIEILTTGGVFPAKRYFTRGSKRKIAKLLDTYFPDEGYTPAQMVKFGMTGDFLDDLMRKDVSHLNIEASHLTYILKMFRSFGYDFTPVTIMTIHQAKGLEADTVVLVTDVTKAVYSAEQDPHMIESERRVWYTAITRSIKRIICVTDTDYTGYHSRVRNVIAVFCKNNTIPCLTVRNHASMPL